MLYDNIIETKKLEENKNNKINCRLTAFFLMINRFRMKIKRKDAQKWGKE